MSILFIANLSSVLWLCLLLFVCLYVSICLIYYLHAIFTYISGSLKIFSFLWYSSLQNVEPHFSCLAFGLHVVNCFYQIEHGRSDDVWLLILGHKGFYNLPLDLSHGLLALGKIVAILWGHLISPVDIHVKRNWGPLLRASKNWGLLPTVMWWARRSWAESPSQALSWLEPQQYLDCNLCGASEPELPS